MKTLIRASQLHPDISGLVKTYADPMYPNYDNIYATSGIVAIESGSALVLTLQDGNRGIVNNINSKTGSINITGSTGITTFFQGSTLHIATSDENKVKSLNTLSGNINLIGKGTVDVWPLNFNTIAVSGYTITGTSGVKTYIQNNILKIESDAVYRINSMSGFLNFVGRNGVEISTTGQTLYFDAGSAAFSGVNSLNGIKNGPVLLTAGKDIQILNNDSQKNITINYIGSGWGVDNIATGNVFDSSFIGNNNVMTGNSNVLINGSNNLSENNRRMSLINSSNNIAQNNKDLTVINTSGSYFNNLLGSTVINGRFEPGTYNHPYGFAVGTSSINTFYNSIHMKAKINGFNVQNFIPLKKMRVPRTNYEGIFLQTGSVMVGHIDYVAARYNIMDFYASYDIASDGIYGRKYFIAQRATNVQIEVKDQADLFGGNDNYNVFLSGANDTNLYLVASGYSGHDVVFMANLYYTQFNLSLSDE
jgi:hypothetical protein